MPKFFFLIYLFNYNFLQLMDPTKPNPERFSVYTMLPDGKGFTIKGCKFIFKLDRHGGWRDEYGNYYNANGEPDFEPQDAQLTPSEGSLHSDEDLGDDYDEFEPTYDDVDDQEEEQFNSWELRNIEKSSRNMETLSSYPGQKPLRVYFSNMPFKAPPKSVYEAYSKRVPGIINIIFDVVENRRNGEGYFIMEDSKKAEVLVKLEGERVLEREVHFDVEKLHELIMDPIKQSQLTPFWKPVSTFKTFESKQQKKDDIPRFKAAPAEEKKTEQKVQPKKQEQKTQTKANTKVFLAKNEQKQLKPEILKPEILKAVQKPAQKAVEKIQEKPQPKKVEHQYKTYLLNFEIFESKTRFFNWIQQHKGEKDVDFKNINKVEKDGQIKIFIDFKIVFADKINGKTYNGKKVQLKPV